MGASLKRQRNDEQVTVNTQDQPDDCAERPTPTQLSPEGNTNSDRSRATTITQPPDEICKQSNTADDVFSEWIREDKQVTTPPVQTTSYVASSAILEAVSHLSHSERNEFELWMRQHSKLRIMVTGRTGVGKSTLLNGLTGINTFDEGHNLKPCTSNVVTREYKRYGISVVVHDCPGLQDGSGQEDQYLREIKEKVTEGVDIMLYCISMKVRRAAELRRHCNAIDMLTKTLGNGIWENALVVLTFGNSYEMGLRQSEYNNHLILEHFNQRLKEWKCEVHSALKKNGVEDSVIDKITVQPAGYFKEPSLPGRKFWLSELWAHVFVAVSEQGQPAYVKLSEGRLKRESEATNDEMATLASNQNIFISPEVERIILGASSPGAAAADNSFIEDQSGPFGTAITAGGAAGLIIVQLLKSLYAKFKAKAKGRRIDLQKPTEDTWL